MARLSELNNMVREVDFLVCVIAQTYITPHISGWTDGTVKRRITAIAANIEKLDRGEPLSNIVQDRQAP